MIIVRAPMRLSFVGGGTDLHDFYRQTPGRVLSVAIDKYVYVAINPTPLIEKVSARYSSYESVDHSRLLKNNRMRAALLDFGIVKNIEISTFSHISERSGLGSPSSFAVALMKGLTTFLGKKIDALEAAQAACRLEIELLCEPLGKQDQYVAALGGFNLLTFHPDERVEVDPLYCDYRKLEAFRNHLMLFFTGISRNSRNVLADRKKLTQNNFDILSVMAGKPLEFKDFLLRENYRKLGELLHENWEQKKSLTINTSTAELDEMYDEALRAGAWGGKILGSGYGGCMLVMVPPDRRALLSASLSQYAHKKNITEFKEIPFQFVQSGVELVVNHCTPAHNACF